MIDPRKSEDTFVSQKQIKKAYLHRDITFRRKTMMINDMERVRKLIKKDTMNLKSDLHKHEIEMEAKFIMKQLKTYFIEEVNEEIKYLKRYNPKNYLE